MKLFKACKAILGALIVATFASCVAQTGTWMTYNYPDDGFRISLPSDPQIQIVPGQPGSSTETRRYSVHVGGSVLYVHVIRIGSGGGSTAPEVMLQGFKDGALELSNNRVVSEKKIALDSAPGIDLETENGITHIRSRAYAVGPTLYALTVAYPIREPFDHAAEFLDSFKLIVGPPGLSNPASQHLP